MFLLLLFVYFPIWQSYHKGVRKGFAVVLECKWQKEEKSRQSCEQMGKPSDSRNHGVLKKWKATLSGWCVWSKEEINGGLRSEREAISFVVLGILVKDFVFHSKINGQL